MIYLELFFTFFKIGLFTFGGGYAMLPLIQEEVIAHQWLTLNELINFIAVSESTPGPFAVNVSTYVGMERGGILGAFCATLGVILPSFIIILIIAKCYESFKNSKIVKGCMSGLKPAVIGLIGTAVVTTAMTVLFPDGWKASEITSFSFASSLAILIVMVILAQKKIHPILIIVFSGIIGIIIGYL